MRIVGGKFRGRILSGSESNHIRPTRSQTREALFNILSHVYPEALNATYMVDMFAGVGSIGLEALSRGCRYVFFIDNNIKSLNVIRKNISVLGVEEHTKVLLWNVVNIQKLRIIKPFQFIFLDPPYGKKLGERALESAETGGWIAPGALVVLEEHIDADLSLSSVFRMLQKRRFRDTQMHFFRYCPKQ
ncbi:Ribosomal RNA small subunit methyltransferase D [Liberibacter crescens BT-1]|uniref:Ribosomal RNA small subunit methyltransferase D n=1 Tax=Liberibacter crescens (strain BT-1) TaxID=1215343 RepID=L0EV06_LIBCB|nr:16S rRNA (guanine(966)-N(2))-methyltransferase RsmD [Liberibacter crescens]AGA64221.1 Ribosomal RNA small subunit methyltransferase D [Liberibacter crescens BT-1]AMC12468.1 DNA methyltransferase [Liberibacter crescens]